MDSSMPWIDCTLTRGPIRGKDRNNIGLILRVQARAEVEDFMRNLTSGQQLSVDQYPGEPWTVVGSGGPLMVYDVGGLIRYSTPYGFEGPGSGLLIKSQEARALRGNPDFDMVNLSFLTVVGLTEGVSIGIPGAFSTEYITRFRALLPQAIKKFLVDYLVPVTINLQIISRG